MRHYLAVLKREARIGPRSPFVYWALVLPAFMTIVMQGVFGGLFEAEPRLAIVDHGSSEVTFAAGSLDGVEVTVLDSEAALLDRVESNEFDAGLILQDGFDEAVRAGDRPVLEFYVGGESLASNRAILGVSAIDLVREMEGSAAPVEVEIVSLSESDLNFAQRTIPMVVIIALAASALDNPAD